MNHLKSQHKVTESSVPCAKNEEVTASGETTQQCDIRAFAETTKSPHTKKGNINELANMVITDLCSVGMVERRGFRSYVQYVTHGEPVHASRSAVRTAILKKAKKARELVKNALSSLDMGVRTLTPNPNPEPNPPLPIRFTLPRTGGQTDNSADTSLSR